MAFPRQLNFKDPLPRPQPSALSISVLCVHLQTLTLRPCLTYKDRLLNSLYFFVKFCNWFDVLFLHFSLRNVKCLSNFSLNECYFRSYESLTGNLLRPLFSTVSSLKYGNLSFCVANTGEKSRNEPLSLGYHN